MLDAVAVKAVMRGAATGSGSSGSVGGSTGGAVGGLTGGVAALGPVGLEGAVGPVGVREKVGAWSLPALPLLSFGTMICGPVVQASNDVEAMIDATMIQLRGKQLSTAIPLEDAPKSEFGH